MVPLNTHNRAHRKQYFWNNVSKDINVVVFGYSPSVVLLDVACMWREWRGDQKGSQCLNGWRVEGRVQNYRSEPLWNGYLSPKEQANQLDELLLPQNQCTVWDPWNHKCIQKAKAPRRFTNVRVSSTLLSLSINRTKLILWGWGQRRVWKIHSCQRLCRKNKKC